MHYWEASAKDNYNVSELMEDLMEQVYQNKFATKSDVPGRSTFKL